MDIFSRNAGVYFDIYEESIWLALYKLCVLDTGQIDRLQAPASFGLCSSIGFAQIKCFYIKFCQLIKKMVITFHLLDLMVVSEVWIGQCNKELSASTDMNWEENNGTERSFDGSNPDDNHTGFPYSSCNSGYCIGV